MSIVIRDRTTPSQQLLVDTDGSIISTLRDGTTSGNHLAISSDGSLPPPVITKGTQGTVGYTTQDLKDAGRVCIYWTVDQFAFAVNTEALLTVTESRDGAATTTFTTKVVTSGKRLRLTAISAGLEQKGGTPIAMPCYIGIRFNTAGAATASSPLVYRFGLSVLATARGVAISNIALPDGMEFLGDGTKQIGISAILPLYVVTSQLASLTLSVYGFEY